MIIYSYDGSTANLIELSAYKINNYKIEFFQSLTTTFCLITLYTNILTKMEP